MIYIFFFISVSFSLSHSFQLSIEIQIIDQSPSSRRTIHIVYRFQSVCTLYLCASTLYTLYRDSFIHLKIKKKTTTFISDSDKIFFFFLQLFSIVLTGWLVAYSSTKSYFNAIPRIKNKPTRNGMYVLIALQK